MLIQNNQGIKKVKSYLPIIGYTVTIIFVSMSLTFFAVTATAQTTVAQTCIDQTSNSWNELQTIKERLNNEIDFLQATMANDNKDNRDRLGL